MTRTTSDLDAHAIEAPSPLSSELVLLAFCISGIPAPPRCLSPAAPLPRVVCL